MPSGRGAKPLRASFNTIVYPVYGFLAANIVTILHNVGILNLYLVLLQIGLICAKSAHELSLSLCARNRQFVQKRCTSCLLYLEKKPVLGAIYMFKNIFKHYVDLKLDINMKCYYICTQCINSKYGRHQPPQSSPLREEENEQMAS